MSRLCTLANVAIGALLLTVAGCEKTNKNTDPGGDTDQGGYGSANNTGGGGGGAPPTATGNAAGEKPPTPAAAGPGPGAATKGPVKLATSGPRSDPHDGKFTLAQATDGLAGKGKLTAEVTTEFGKITCTLLPDKSPKTVASFVGLARGKRAWQDPYTGIWQQGVPFFDGLAFHRVIPNFMIQGGDPRSRDYSDRGLGTGTPGYRIVDEADDNTRFKRGGLLAMANGGPGTNSGGSQFFITEVPRPSLDRGYTIFGECDAIDVVKTIARQPVARPNKPLTAITMQITISRK